MFRFLAVTGLFLFPFTASALYLDGPIVPQCSGAGSNPAACNFCDLIHLFNNGLGFAVEFTVIIATLMFVYAGVLYFSASAKQENIKKAHGIFGKVFIGLVVVLAAWLLVDILMKTLVGNQQFGVWNEIDCVGVMTTADVARSTTPGGASVRTTGPPSRLVQCPPSNTACSPASLQAAGFTAPQANAMSCIAMTESSGNPNGPNSSTGACGTFQVIRGNWNNPAFHQGSCTVNTSCNNAACNMQTAYLLAQGRVRNGQSPYSDWTCPGCNANALPCVCRYDPAGDSRCPR